MDKISYKQPDTRLSGLHTSWICWCESEKCSRYQIIWISEYQELPPLKEEIFSQLYEIKWGLFDNRWFCPDCFQSLLTQNKRNQFKLPLLEKGVNNHSAAYATSTTQESTRDTISQIKPT